ncbi:MAG: hypothetical protein R2795_20000 [Saprospiraceae bacterium]
MCESEATVIIEDQTQTPVAVIDNTPETLVVSCSTENGITLDGSGSEDGMNYQWYNGNLDTPIAGVECDTLQDYSSWQLSIRGYKHGHYRM